MSNYRLGIIAVVPFWSQSDNMNADSNYAYLRIVLPEMVRQSPETLFLIFFPDPKRGRDKWKYVPDGLQNERIRFIPWPYDTQMQSSVLGFAPERFYEIEVEYGPNIYWLNQVEMGIFFQNGYAKSYGRGQTPALIAQHHYIIHRSLPYVYEQQFSRQWLQIGGSLASDKVLFNSNHCYNMAQEAFAEYLTDQQMEKLNQKSQVLPFALLRGNEPYSPEAGKGDSPIFIYNHRFEYYKRPDLTFGLLWELRDNYQFEVWATQVAGQMTGGSKNYFFDKSVFAPARENYLENIAVPAINTINSVHETFCISILDSLALGHLVVLPNRVTFPEFVPEGYPYLFNSINEQKAMLEKILSTWPIEYNRWHKELSSYAREKFDVSQYVSDYLRVFRGAEEIHRQHKHKKHTLNILQKLFNQMEKGKKYPPLELRRVLSKSLNLNCGGTQSMPTRRVVREAMLLRDDISVVWDNGIKLIKS